MASSIWISITSPALKRSLYFNIILSIPFYYPPSLIWILIYTIAGKRLERMGNSKIASLLVVTIILVAIIMCLHYLFSFPTYLPVFLVLVFCFATCGIKLYIPKQELGNEDILDAGLD